MAEKKSNRKDTGLNGKFWSECDANDSGSGKRKKSAPKYKFEDFVDDYDEGVVEPKKSPVKKRYRKKVSFNLPPLVMTSSSDLSGLSSPDSELVSSFMTDNDNLNVSDSSFPTSWDSTTSPYSMPVLILDPTTTARPMGVSGFNTSVVRWFSSFHAGNCFTTETTSTSDSIRPCSSSSSLIVSASAKRPASDSNLPSMSVFDLPSKFDPQEVSSSTNESPALASIQDGTVTPAEDRSVSSSSTMLSHAIAPGPTSAIEIPTFPVLGRSDLLISTLPPDVAEGSLESQDHAREAVLPVPQLPPGFSFEYIAFDQQPASTSTSQTTPETLNIGQSSGMIFARYSDHKWNDVMGSFKMVRAFENEDMIINFVKIYPGNTFMLRIEEVVSLGSSKAFTVLSGTVSVSTKKSSAKLIATTRDMFSFNIGDISVIKNMGSEVAEIFVAQFLSS